MKQFIFSILLFLPSSYIWGQKIVLNTQKINSCLYKISLHNAGKKSVIIPDIDRRFEEDSVLKNFYLRDSIVSSKNDTVFLYFTDRYEMSRDEFKNRFAATHMQDSLNVKIYWRYNDIKLKSKQTRHYSVIFKDCFPYKFIKIYYNENFLAEGRIK